MLIAVRPRLGARVLAEEVVFARRRQPGVAVGGADHAKFVRIDAKVLFQLQANLQGAARVFILQHIRLLRNTEVQVTLVPGLVVGELVVRRQRGMRLTVPLDLGDLVERLPPRAGLGVLQVHRLAAERLHHGEHDAVAQVAVVANGERLAAGLVLVGP